jgi:hypothetical protein
MSARTPQKLQEAADIMVMQVYANYRRRRRGSLAESATPQDYVLALCRSPDQIHESHRVFDKLLSLESEQMAGFDERTNARPGKGISTASQEGKLPRFLALRYLVTTDMIE